MKTCTFLFILFLLTGGLNSCDKDTAETLTTLQKLDTTRYYSAEIFSGPEMKVYGTWKLFDVSGGFTGHGHDLNFEFLKIKEYGIYGFFRNDTLLEYGKISPAVPTTNDLRLIVVFEKDEKSPSFFADREKYIEFAGSDTMHLNSPCCDRYNYHFERVK